MNAGQTEAVLGLDDAFPEELYILFHPASNRYGCYCYRGVHGLACFGIEENATSFSEWSDLTGMTILCVSFDEAREVAKSRPMPVVSVMLLDDLDHPAVHYVR